MIYRNGKKSIGCYHNGKLILKRYHMGHLVYSNEYLRHVAGEIPLHLPYSLGKNLVDWSITGNTMQDGTPTPDNPVEVKMVGDLASNLFSGEMESGTIDAWGNLNNNSARLRTKDFTILKAGMYTFSATSEHGNLIFYAFIYNMDGTFYRRAGTYGDYWSNDSVTIVLDKDYKCKFICSFSDLSTDISVSDVKDVRINRGTVVLPYEPYGYKVPVVTRGRNLFDANKYYGSVATVSGNSVTGRVVDIHRVNIDDCFEIGKTYTFSCNATCPADTTFVRLEAEENGSFKRSNSIKSGESGFMSMTFTPKKGCVIRITFGSGSQGIVTYSNIQLELGTEPTPFEPYHTPITTNLYLPELLAKGEVLKSDGSREEKWGKYVCTGNETWSMIDQGAGNSQYFYIASPNFTGKPWKPSGAVYCNYAINRITTGVTMGNSYGFLCWFAKDIVDSMAISKWVEWVKSKYESGNPLTFIYELAEPTTEQIETIPIETFEGNTYLKTSTEVTPTAMSATYKADRP